VNFSRVAHIRRLTDGGWPTLWGQGGAPSSRSVRGWGTKTLFEDPKPPHPSKPPKDGAPGESMAHPPTFIGKRAVPYAGAMLTGTATIMDARAQFVCRE
jgi:hypothetical protein